MAVLEIKPTYAQDGAAALLIHSNGFLGAAVNRGSNPMPGSQTFEFAASPLRCDRPKAGLPAQDQLASLERDYQAMQTMLFGKPPDFNSIVEGLKALENEINSLERRTS